MIKKSIVVFVFFLLYYGLFAQDSSNYLQVEKPANIHEINRRIVNLTKEILEEKHPPSDVFDTSSIPVFSDTLYQLRLRELDVKSPIKLDFQPIVKNYIEAYALRNREHTARILGKAELYFPLFEKYLDRYNLPLELKYLSVIESALNPRAHSRSGAIGLWQFMYNASRMFDLKITSYVDERMDPEKATEAACKYLQYLYRVFGDWQMVIAAYNGGPGMVRNAIHQSGGKTEFWEISSYLSDQAYRHVAAFIAVNYVMNYSRQHNIIPVKPEFLYFQIGNVKITRALSFKQIATVLNISIDVLRDLNPVYKRDFIPQDELPAELYLPMNLIGDFIKNEQEIYAVKLPEKKFFELQKELSSTKEKTCVIHEVKQGEFLHKIAMKYSCTERNIMDWNQLVDDKLSIGQQLKIWVHPADTVNGIL